MGCIVSLTAPTRSSLSVSRSVLLRGWTKKASRVFAASHLRRYKRLSTGASRLVADICDWLRRWAETVPLALRSKSLERQQGNVVFLLPLFSGELLQLGQQRIDQRRTLWVCTNIPLHSWETKHLTLRTVGLDEPIAVEEDALTGL